MVYGKLFSSVLQLEMEMENAELKENVRMSNKLIHWIWSDYNDEFILLCNMIFMFYFFRSIFSFQSLSKIRLRQSPVSHVESTYQFSCRATVFSVDGVLEFKAVNDTQLTSLPSLLGRGWKRMDHCWGLIDFSLCEPFDLLTLLNGSFSPQGASDAPLSVAECNLTPRGEGVGETLNNKSVFK